MKQRDALELEMKLEASPIVDNSSSMGQFQSKLQVLTLQLQYLTKWKEKCKGLWCTTCSTKGHDRGECPMIIDYLTPKSIGSNTTIVVRE